MGNDFEHVQYVNDMVLKITDDPANVNIEIATGTGITDEEVYRAKVDAGFNGNISFLEFLADFRGKTDNATGYNVTWKFQYKAKGQSSWTDLISKTQSWSSTDTNVNERIRKDDSALGSNAAISGEVRLLLTCSQGSLIITVNIGTQYGRPVIMILGETT